MHVNTADPDARFPCLQCCMCDKTFRHMCLFMKHMRRHLKISPYRCGLCGKTVNTYASLQLHQKRLHGAVTAAAAAATSEAASAGEELPADGKERLFHCQLCSKSFVTKGHLKVGLNFTHGYCVVIIITYISFRSMLAACTRAARTRPTVPCVTRRSERRSE